MPNLELLWNGALIPPLSLTLLFPLTPPVLAQFAYGFSVVSLLGIGLIFCGLALYLLRSIRPNLARDHDIFFAAVSLICGGIMFFQGWRLDAILQFGQFLLAGSAIFFAIENIRMRGIVTQQAKRNTPIVDDDRPVSVSYRTYGDDRDEIEPYEASPAQPLRRIMGSRDGRRTTRPVREAGQGYDNRSPERPGRPVSRSGGDYPRRRSSDRDARDLNLRYDSPPEDYDRDYGDRYGSRDPREARPSRGRREMKATLEGYDTYTAGGSVYEDAPSQARGRGDRPSPSDRAPAPGRETYSEPPRRPAADRYRDAADDDYAEFYRDDNYEQSRPDVTDRPEKPDSAGGAADESDESVYDR